MSANDTHAQRHTRPLRRAWFATSVLAIAACLFGAWTWWLRPKRQADARADEATNVAARARAERELALTLDASDAALSWTPPSACVEVYRLRVDEEFRDPSVDVLGGRPEQHASWTLALAASPRSRTDPVGTDPIAVDSLLVADDPSIPSRRRRLWWSAQAVGPAAPDLACRQRGWDPLEDALALAWPRLPGHTARVGARWRGASVEGRCHETTCVDASGQFAHDRPCRADPWSEQLAGAGEDIALVLGRWEDGHTGEIGILTSREALIHAGRPLRVRATVEHRWSGVTRELELWRIDDCSARSLATPEDRSAIEQIRARLRRPPGE